MATGQNSSASTSGSHAHSVGDEVPPPTGTLFVMITYLAILAGMWGVMYIGLIGR